MKKNAITAVIAALFLISALFVAGCAAPDNRTPLEKLMAAMVQTGGNGSEDTSVSANIPLSVANETLTLTAEKDANRLTFVHTAPLPGGTDLATTGLSSKAETTLQIDLSTGKAEFAQTNSMSFMGRNITTTGKGSFDAR